MHCKRCSQFSICSSKAFKVFAVSFYFMFLNIQFLYVHHQAAVIQKIQLLRRIIQQLGWEGTLTITQFVAFFWPLSKSSVSFLRCGARLVRRLCCTRLGSEPSSQLMEQLSAARCSRQRMVRRAGALRGPSAAQSRAGPWALPRGMDGASLLFACQGR